MLQEVRVPRVLQSEIRVRKVRHATTHTEGRRGGSAFWRDFFCGCVKQQDERGETEESRRKLHFEPRKEFLLQDPVADWLVADSASVGVAGADPPKPRPLATLTTSTDGLIGSSAAESPPPLSGRTLPDAFTLLLPARTYTHTTADTRPRSQKHAVVFGVQESVQ
jgi:hypothetical protein